MRHIDSLHRALVAARSLKEDARIVAQYVWSKSIPGRCEHPITQSLALSVPSLFILYTHTMRTSRRPTGTLLYAIMVHVWFRLCAVISLFSAF